MKKNRIKCNDIILISIILITAILFLAGYNLFFHKKGNYVQVTADGRLVENLPLDVDTTITIDGYNNGKNVLQIKDGYASIIEADCPDKLCQKQKKIRYTNPPHSRKTSELTSISIVRICNLPPKFPIAYQETDNG